jgi:hypothetical protein
MSYEHQIRILEAELKKLESSNDKEDLEKMSDIINKLRRLRRDQWEEEHERVNLDDDR